MGSSLVSSFISLAGLLQGSLEQSFLAVICCPCRMYIVWPRVLVWPRSWAQHRMGVASLDPVGGPQY